MSRTLAVQLPFALVLQRLGFGEVTGIDRVGYFLRISRAKEGKTRRESQYRIDIVTLPTELWPSARGSRRAAYRWWEFPAVEQLVRYTLLAHGGSLLSPDIPQTFVINGRGELLPDSVKPLKVLN